MSSPAIFLLVAYLGVVLCEVIDFQKNSDIVYTKQAFGEVEYVMIDGVPITQARNGTHCVPPNDCFEVIPKTNYLIVSGKLAGKSAYIEIQPPAGLNRSAVGFVYKLSGSEDPKLSEGVSNVYTKEVANASEMILHIIVFDEPTGMVNAVGDVVANRRDWNKLTLLGKTGFAHVNVVLCTGHVTDKPRNVVIKFENGKQQNLTLNPTSDPKSPSAVMTYIDFRDSFKLNEIASPLLRA